MDEFGLVLHEMRIGESRSAALKNLSERVDVPEVAQFCRAIIQADQLGIALSRILRVQSHDMRITRQLAAEEKAMKAPVKMLFPTVIFIFPSMFVVALGPAALNLMKTSAAAEPHAGRSAGQTSFGCFAAGGVVGQVITRTSIVSAPRRTLRSVSMTADDEVERFMDILIGNRVRSLNPLAADSLGGRATWPSG